MTEEEPAFLDPEQVEDLHRVALERHGGQDGIRDQAAFESAVMQPRNVWYYAQGDLFDVAAAYAFHLSTSPRPKPSSTEPQGDRLFRQSRCLERQHIEAL